MEPRAPPRTRHTTQDKELRERFFETEPTLPPPPSEKNLLGSEISRIISRLGISRCNFFAGSEGNEYGKFPYKSMKSVGWLMQLVGGSCPGSGVAVNVTAR